mmetsp:Transcript_20258/g.41399  ORF Transcript_20258/g.41399 Transcript_20258/m.41399 type:complete len:209 (-) Transcript_20258:200-826(-)|eukprot:CAMPEP_0119090456 /NCGR_PEP_ID=MMETSP1178-20130426/152772_1 /TAXON_ID=33656 /ORGANISM="unid sp, Strain CCMP2000" /LENGTH=208 /DNA_ID=CAMNT_0007073885 /DNA_START=61 /DNA_END=687 /DNA_ORIENTATION=+
MANPFSTVALEPTYDAPGPNVALQGGATPGTLPPMKKITMFFHALFKVLALVMYICSKMFFSGHVYVLTFVVVTIFSAFDFWTVKNVSGRLLVGLRWWSDVDEHGHNHWRFESYEEQRFIHPTDSSFFWAVLFVTPVIWAILGFLALITFNIMWALLTGVALTCNAVNVVGYVKCKKDARKKLSALGGSVMLKGMEMWSSRKGASSGA